MVKTSAQSNEADFPVVGIGASAGGLEPLNELVKAIPPHSGLAYVIIQHLSPDHPSMMDQLLASHASIPVSQIEDGARIEANRIYVLPAGPSATLSGGRLILHDRAPERGLRTPIDQFFESLAEEKRRAAFGVILSGTGSDGTRGVRAIKAAGGFAIVQESDSAQFPGMPDSAAATGLVDFSLKPANIPDRLIEIVRHRDELEGRSGPAEVRRGIEEALPEILDLIGGDDGHDFSQYKTGTLVRRIERRMTLIRARDAASFLDRLRESGRERQSLLNDFLIGVTRFFRDEDAFVKLNQEAILPLLGRDQGAFRIWVPGCATGEEAYSIAMLMAEAMAAAEDHRQWQIFGTDIDASALRHARAGIYSESQVEDLTPERRERFLVGTDGNFQIAPALRERCVFAPHNLVQDPPFSKLDLISCRNLFIYLNADIQAAIVPRFHYALREGGYLFLGPSETLGKQDRFFETVDRDARLFRRNDAEQAAFSTLNSAGESAARRERRRVRPAGIQTAQPAGPPEPNFEQQLLNFFARQAAPAFAAINASDEVSYLSERMSRYVRPAQGEPSAALDQFLIRDLRIPVRSVIADARESGGPVRLKNVVVDEAGEPHLIDLDAQPLPFAEGSILVTLQPVRTQDAAALTDSTEARSDAERDLIERELAMTRKQLNATLSDYEITEQELKSSNEELLSMNEELQSSNEELETSREELQSINEELETVNAELSENNRQLMAANSDLRNLFDSTDIATVFLDQNLCVRRYTPTSRRVFGIQDRDIGRSINDLKWKVSYDELEADAAHVAQTLQPVEREVTIPVTQETFLMRIRPYRRTDDRIDGSIITFFDITERKRIERQLQENADALARQYAELETLYSTTPVGLNLLDRDLRYLRINERLAEINGYPVEYHIGKRQDEIVPDIDDKIRETQMRVMETGEAALGYEVQGVTPAEPDVERHWIVDYYPVRKDGEVFAIGTCVREVTEQKRLQQKLEESEARLTFAMETSRLGAWELDVSTGMVERTLLHDQVFGYDEFLPEWNFDIFMDHVIAEDRDMVRSRFEEAVETGKPWTFECRITRPDGQVRWIAANGRPIFDDAGKAVVRFLGTVQDVTQRKDAEAQQSLLLHELQHRVKNTLATTIAVVRFSARRATSVEAFTSTLQDRLLAISRTHDVLTSNEWRGERLSRVIRREVCPYVGDASDRANIDGDDPLLSPKQTLALSLAFHELATNAAKHGALLSDEGRISVRAHIAEDGCLEISWTETGGPEVHAPDEGSTGFGTFLLERILGPDLDGTTQIDHRPEGLVWQGRFPLRGQ